MSIVDDDGGVRDSLRLLLGSHAGFRIQSAHVRAADALDALPAQQPDVLLLDVRMPGMDGLELLHRIRPHLPHTRIVMLTGYGSDDVLHHALSGGANAFVCKAQGEAPLLQALSQSTLDRFCLPRGLGAALDLPAFPELTLRERRLLPLLAEGRTAKEIASELGLAQQSISNLLNATYRRWHCRNATQWVAMTMRLGLLAGRTGNEK